MRKRHAAHPFIAVLFGLAALALTDSAIANPPARVARLGYLSGAVSFSPAGEDEWVLADANRPLTTGDRLWADADGRTELQLGAATVRMDHNTSATVLNLDDRVAQFKLDQGTLNVRVRRMAAAEVYEVDTPNLAFSIQRPGRYRIDVDPSGDSTYVAVREGAGEAYGEGTAYLIRSQQSYRFSGTDLRSYAAVELPPPDDFERWCSDRDRRQHNARSVRHVSVDVIGYEDLDDYGTWHTVEDYGEVWTPTRVAPDWAPYRTGRWTWIDPWGWTWVDDEPWGFAPFHYGRWVHLGEEWSWVPGPAESRPIYAPALVAFIGGGLSLALSGQQTTPDIAWFPLGPGDVYQPAYPVSRDYFTDVNVTNTRIDRSYVTNVYNNPSATRLRYLNRQVPGAVVAVPAAAFIGARPVARAAVPVARDFISRAPVTAVAPVAPVRASVTGGAPPAPNKRPLHVSDRPAVVIHAPPAPIGFAAKEGALARQPGKPFDANAVSAPRPVTPLAPKLRLIKPVQPVIPVPKPPTGPAAPPAPPTGPAAPATHPLGIPPVTPQGAEHKPQAPPQPTQGRPAIPSGARPEGIPVPRPPQPELQEHRAAPPARAEVPHPPAHPVAPPAPAAAQPEHRPSPAPAAPPPRPPQPELREHRAAPPARAEVPYPPAHPVAPPPPAAAQPEHRPPPAPAAPPPRPPQPELREHRAAPPPRAEVPRPPAHPVAPPPPAAAQPEHRPPPAPAAPPPRPPQPELREHRAAPPPRAEVPRPPAHPVAPPPPAAAHPEHRPPPAPAAPHPAAPPKAGGKVPPQQEQDKEPQTGK